MFVRREAVNIQFRLTPAQRGSLPTKSWLWAGFQSSSRSPTAQKRSNKACVRLVCGYLVCRFSPAPIWSKVKRLVKTASVLPHASFYLLTFVLFYCFHLALHTLLLLCLSLPPPVCFVCAGVVEHNCQRASPWQCAVRRGRGQRLHHLGYTDQVSGQGETESSSFTNFTNKTWNKLHWLTL